MDLNKKTMRNVNTNRRRNTYRSERESQWNRKRNEDRSSERDHDDQFNRDRAHNYGSIYDDGDFEDESERILNDGESEHFFNDDRNREGYPNNNEPVNRGYRRRRNNEPNPYYTDKYTYRTSDFDRGPFRKNDISDNYNQYNEGYEQEDDRGYDYFESYPRYGNNTPIEDRARNNEDFHLERDWRSNRPRRRNKHR
jgi:hypothetical protein